MTDTSANPNLLGGAAERRAFRDRMSRGIEYFIPPELRPLLGFAAEMTPSAAVERGGAASMRAVQPDRTAMERLGDIGEVLSETAAIGAPVAVAGRAAMPAAQAAQEAFLGVSVPARAAAAPAPLPPPRNAREETSDEIARLLREGKDAEAEALLDFADDRRLYQLYERGEVGRDLPVDFESAQARGREMGFVEDEYIGSMEPGIRSLDPRMARGDRRYSGTWSSDNPYLASSYADPRLGSVYPLLTRGMPEDAVRFDAQGANWRDLPGYESADIGGQSTGPISVRLSNMGEAGMRGNYDTNQVARIAFYDGLPGAEFRNVVDRGPQAPFDPNNPEVLREFQRRGAEPSLVRSRQDTRGVRSRFARFDPRFAGSRNLMAGFGGAGAFLAAPDAEEAPAVRNYQDGGPVTRPEPRPITLGAVPTGEMTRFGRPVFENPSSDRFSELTVTVPYGDRFVVAPSIYVEGGRPRVLSDAEVMEMLARHGPVDLMTNQELPTFSTIEEADAYARSRSDAMFGPEGFADGGEVFRGIGSLASVARGMFRA